MAEGPEGEVDAETHEKYDSHFKARQLRQELRKARLRPIEHVNAKKWNKLATNVNQTMLAVNRLKGKPTKQLPLNQGQAANVIQTGWRNKKGRQQAPQESTKETGAQEQAVAAENIQKTETSTELATVARLQTMRKFQQKLLQGLRDGRLLEGVEAKGAAPLEHTQQVVLDRAQEAESATTSGAPVRPDVATQAKKKVAFKEEAEKPKPASLPTILKFQRRLLQGLRDGSLESGVAEALANAFIKEDLPATDYRKHFMQSASSDTSTIKAEPDIASKPNLADTTVVPEKAEGKPDLAAKPNLAKPTVATEKADAQTSLAAKPNLPKKAVAPEKALPNAFIKEDLPAGRNLFMQSASSDTNTIKAEPGIAAKPILANTTVAPEKAEAKPDLAAKPNLAEPTVATEKAEAQPDLAAKPNLAKTTAAPEKEKSRVAGWLQRAGKAARKAIGGKNERAEEPLSGAAGNLANIVIKEVAEVEAAAKEAAADEAAATDALAANQGAAATVAPRRSITPPPGHWDSTIRRRASKRHEAAEGQLESRMAQLEARMARHSALKQHGFQQAESEPGANVQASGTLQGSSQNRGAQAQLETRMAQLEARMARHSAWKERGFLQTEPAPGANVQAKGRVVQSKEKTAFRVLESSKGLREKALDVLEKSASSGRLEKTLLETSWEDHQEINTEIFDTLWDAQCEGRLAVALQEVALEKSPKPVGGASKHKPKLDKAASSLEAWTPWMQSMEIETTKKPKYNADIARTRQSLAAIEAFSSWLETAEDPDEISLEDSPRVSGKSALEDSQRMSKKGLRKKAFDVLEKSASSRRLEKTLLETSWEDHQEINTEIFDTLWDAQCEGRLAIALREVAVEESPKTDGSSVKVNSSLRKADSSLEAWAPWSQTMDIETATAKRGKVEVTRTRRSLDAMEAFNSWLDDDADSPKETSLKPIPEERTLNDSPQFAGKAAPKKQPHHLEKGVGMYQGLREKAFDILEKGTSNGRLETSLLETSWEDYLDLNTEIFDMLWDAQLEGRLAAALKEVAVEGSPELTERIVRDVKPTLYKANSSLDAWTPWVQNTEINTAMTKRGMVEVTRTRRSLDAIEAFSSWLDDAEIPDEIALEKIPEEISLNDSPRLTGQAAKAQAQGKDGFAKQKERRAGLREKAFDILEKGTRDGRLETGLLETSWEDYLDLNTEIFDVLWDAHCSGRLATAMHEVVAEGSPKLTERAVKDPNPRSLQKADSFDGWTPWVQSTETKTATTERGTVGVTRTRRSLEAMQAFDSWLEDAETPAAMPLESIPEEVSSNDSHRLAGERFAKKDTARGEPKAVLSQERSNLWQDPDQDTATVEGHNLEVTRSRQSPDAMEDFGNWLESSPSTPEKAPAAAPKAVAAGNAQGKALESSATGARPPKIAAISEPALEQDVISQRLGRAPSTPSRFADARENRAATPFADAPENKAAKAKPAEVAVVASPALEQAVAANPLGCREELQAARKHAESQAGALTRLESSLAAERRRARELQVELEAAAAEPELLTELTAADELRAQASTFADEAACAAAEANAERQWVNTEAAWHGWLMEEGAVAGLGQLWAEATRLQGIVHDRVRTHATALREINRLREQLSELHSELACTRPLPPAAPCEVSCHEEAQASVGRPLAPKAVVKGGSRKRIVVLRQASPGARARS